MKKILIITILIISFVINLSSQVVVRETSEWKSYSGKLIVGKTQIRITANILFGNEGYIMGFYKEIDNQKAHKMIGTIVNDTLIYTIRDQVTDSVEGFWIATLHKQDKILQGKYIQTNGTLIGQYRLKLWNLVNEEFAGVVTDPISRKEVIERYMI